MERTVLVVIPTYNEAENIEKIVSRLHAANPQVHVLIADDNSPDGTGAIADALSVNDPRVHVLHRAGKEGLGPAYIAGFTWGLEKGYDVLVEMDADGSHQPEQLPAILAKLDEADMVKGSRWMAGGSVVNWDKKRELLSRSANIWVQAVMDLNIRDVTGGFNAMTADILRRIDLDDIASKGYNFQIDLTRRIVDAGGVVAEVPIEFQEREFGVSKMSGNIIGEALARTAVWGLKKRLGQARSVIEKTGVDLQPVADRAKEVSEKAKELATSLKERAAQAGEYLKGRFASGDEWCSCSTTQHEDTSQPFEADEDATTGSAN